MKYFSSGWVQLQIGQNFQKKLHNNCIENNPQNSEIYQITGIANKIPKIFKKIFNIIIF